MIPESVLKLAEDIKAMRIRGAGRIARAVAKGLAEAATAYTGDSLEEFNEYIRRVAKLLRETRPTAVSLPNAISYILSRYKRDLEYIERVHEARESIITHATEFIKYSLEAVKKIGIIGSHMISSGETILTHCNSSTALEIIIRAFKDGKDIEVFATETRPKCQGYITAGILKRNNVPTVLIPDSAIKSIMKKIDKVIVGADAIAANGAVVNKVGTSLIALAANEASVDFIVAAETYKFSPVTVLGELVEIEERDPREVCSEKFFRYKKIKIRNPAFDITPPEYI
ncbi:MAG: ribose 1,5-bisphosphate isomerase, partial [Thermoprotei archaeon]